jgi:spore coat polysaccharide biosynthesis protein SpsF
MGSTRLPGKVLLPLAEKNVLEHVISRVERARMIDTVVVATSSEQQDDIIGQISPEFGAEVYRGSEPDVLGRMFQAAKKHGSEIVVRTTADCPLLDPSVIDASVEKLKRTGADYTSNIQHRTFPRGFDVEAFGFDSFVRVHDEAIKQHHREHVTPYYHENPDEFELMNVTSEDVFSDDNLRNRTDLRLTLDEAADYKLLRRIYDGIPHEEISTKRVIEYIDENSLEQINAHIEQKEVEDASGNSS